MKSVEYRILMTDKNNKIDYRFDSNKFSEALEKCSLASKNKGKMIPRKIFMEKIADKACVSFDAVKKWKSGHNGPGSIEMVEAIAEILGVDSLDLLSPVGKMIEKTQLKQADIDVIHMVYEGILDINQELIRFYEENKHVTAELRKDFYKKRNQLIKKLENNIYKRSLDISLNIKNKLLTLVYELDYQYIPDRWERIEMDYCQSHREDKSHNDGWEYARDYIFFDNRNDLIHCEDMGLEYVYNEIYVAECLGYYDGKYPDDIDYYYEKKLDELCKFGCPDLYLEPRYIYRHMFTNLLLLVFTNDFPEYFDN